MVPFAATQMDLEMITRSDVKSGREAEGSYHVTYMWSLKMIQLPYLQSRNIPTHLENKVIITKGETGRDELGVWD